MPEVSPLRPGAVTLIRIEVVAKNTEHESTNWSILANPGTAGTLSDEALCNVTFATSPGSTVQPSVFVIQAEAVASDGSIDTATAKVELPVPDAATDAGQGQGTHASPATVGITAETEAAQSDTWDRSSQGANDGVNLVCLTRFAYADAGDATLYAYYRTLSYDSQGNLYAVSAETRVTIDVPEACP